MSGGRPPTKTLREYRSWLSEPTECGDERAGELSGRMELSRYPPPSSGMWSSTPWKYGFPVKGEGEGEKSGLEKH